MARWVPTLWGPRASVITAGHRHTDADSGPPQEGRPRLWGARDGKESTTMAVIEGACRQTLEATEFVTIVTQGEAGPHVSATWGDYIRALGIDNDTLVVPVGYLQQTEANLRRDPRVQLLAASRRVQGTHGPGQGCLLTGIAEILADGDLVTRVKEKFPWARGAMLVRVESAKTQL
jgi:hypothetical protein